MKSTNLQYSIGIDALISDTPASAYLDCIKGHTSYLSCERCLAKGVRVEGRIVFNEQECTSRTDDSFSRVEYKNHQIDVSPFITAKFLVLARLSQIICIWSAWEWLDACWFT